MDSLSTRVRVVVGEEPQAGRTYVLWNTLGKGAGGTELTCRLLYNGHWRASIRDGVGRGCSVVGNVDAATVVKDTLDFYLSVVIVQA